MALVSYTQTAAGEPMQFTMNKTDLLAVPKVMADPFFYLESNWFRVSFVFKHTTSGKRFVPSFRTFTGTKYLRVREGMSGGDGFELKKIIISKSDRTFLVIKTSEIPSVGDYTFSLMGSGNGGGGGGNNASGLFVKDFLVNPTLGIGESLKETRYPGSFSPTVNQSGLVLQSDYNNYGGGFIFDVDMAGKSVEVNSTYKFTITGSLVSGGSFPLRATIGSNTFGGKQLKDSQGNAFYGPGMYGAYVFTNGTLEFYITTDSEITDVSNFQKLFIDLDWSYAGPTVSITKIEVTKV